MRAATESDVLVVASRKVERVGVGELFGVAVRRADDRDDEVATPKRLPAQLRVRGDPPGDRPLDRAVEAHQLLDG